MPDFPIPDSIWEYPLDENSNVFIVGAYSGTSAQYYVDKYGPNLYLFEPQVKFAEMLEQRYKDNPKVMVCVFGLGEKEYVGEMSQYGTDAASFIPSDSTYGGKTGLGKVREFGEFMASQNIDYLDLCIMNCEGSEYRILLHLIATGLISQINYIMVQFHPGYEGTERMAEIWEKLALTHDVRDNYYRDWVIWARRNDD